MVSSSLALLNFCFPICWVLVFVHEGIVGQKANFYYFGPMSMKFCMEVSFGGIQLKRCPVHV